MLTNKDLQKIDSLMDKKLDQKFEKFCYEIKVDREFALESKIRPIRIKLEQLENKIENIKEMLTGDIKVTCKDIKKLKKQNKEIQKKIKILEAMYNLKQAKTLRFDNQTISKIKNK